MGVGERGEICVRGPNICLGYWRNEKATNETFDDERFLRTGDVAVRDEKGWYWIVDRKKELIKVRGFQVAPAELEAVLLENEHVADAAVVALQGDHEELPRAYVALKDTSKGKVKEADIQAWTAKQVAKHKQLTGGVKVSLYSSVYLISAALGSRIHLLTLRSLSTKSPSLPAGRSNGKSYVNGPRRTAKHSTNQKQSYSILYTYVSVHH